MSDPTKFGADVIEAMARAHCWFCNATDNHIYCGCKSDTECWDWKPNKEEMRAALVAACAKLREPSEEMLGVMREEQPNPYEQGPTLNAWRAMLSQFLIEIGEGGKD